MLLEETAAEVEALVTATLSDFFVCVVNPRYMATTKDGIRLGPSWWAEKTGMTEEAVRARIKRLRSRSEADSERASAPSTAQQSSVRSARSAIRKFPELAAELIKDPEVQGIIDRLNEAKKHGVETPRVPEIDDVCDVLDFEKHAECALNDLGAIVGIMHNLDTEEVRAKFDLRIKAFRNALEILEEVRNGSTF